MGQINIETTYKCSDDCKQSGCPSHKMELYIQTTSDIMIISIDGNKWFSAEPGQWQALKKLLKETDYNIFNL